MATLAKGDSVGRYFVLGELGRGGAGVVYAAYDPELDRRIALKLVPITDRGSVEPLTREARVLAKLSHPNVASVFDVGVTETFVYIAMEYVDGGNLLEWIEAQPRAPQEIVDVFADAGKGLLAAHQRGLVHRDFKPSNVLLDGDGRVVVADFGLAQLNPEQCEVHTPGHALRGLELQLTGRAGTPGFVAPEVLSGTEPDARADQYAFCVSLFWALTRRMPDEVENPAPALPGIAARPRARAAILRGLAATPQERFATLAELLGELTRRPASRRQRVVGVALIAGLVGGGFIGARLVGSDAEPDERCTAAAAAVAAAWSPHRASVVHRSLTEDGRPFARQTADRVQASLETFSAHWKDEHQMVCDAGDESPGMRARRRCLDDRLMDLDALAEALSTPGGGGVEGAMEAVARLTPPKSCREKAALANRVPMPTPELEEPVGQLRRTLALAAALEETGQFDRARQAVDEVAKEAEAVDYRPLRARIRLLAGRVAMQQGRLVEAEQWLEGAFADALAANDDDALVTAGAHLVYTIGHSQGAPQRAEHWIALTHAALSHAGIGVVARGAFWVSAGVVSMQRGDNDAARSSVERSLSLVSEELTPTHPEAMYALSTLAALDMDEHAYAEAEQRSRRVLTIRTELLGEDHPQLIVDHSTLGGALSAQGKLDEARHHLERARAIGVRSLGADHPRMVGVYNNLGSLLSKEGDDNAALEFYRAALQSRVRSGGPNDPRVALARNNLAAGLYRAGFIQEAADQHRQAVQSFEKNLGEQHPKVALALSGLVADLVVLGRCDEALPLVERARGLLEPHPAQRRILAFVLANEARVHLCREEFERAWTAAQRSLALLDAVLAPSSRASIEAVAARVLLAVGRGQDAQAHATQALTLAGSQHPRTRAWAHWVRATVHQDSGETAAMAVEDRELEQLRPRDGSDDPRWPPRRGARDTRQNR